MSHCHICAKELGPSDVEANGRRNGYRFRNTFRPQCPSWQVQACAERKAEQADAVAAAARLVGAAA